MALHLLLWRWRQGFIWTFSNYKIWNSRRGRLLKLLVKFDEAFNTFIHWSMHTRQSVRWRFDWLFNCFSLLCIFIVYFIQSILIIEMWNHSRISSFKWSLAMFVFLYLIMENIRGDGVEIIISQSHSFLTRSFMF